MHFEDVLKKMLWRGRWSVLKRGGQERWSNAEGRCWSGHEWYYADDLLNPGYCFFGNLMEEQSKPYACFAWHMKVSYIHPRKNVEQ